MQEHESDQLFQQPPGYPFTQQISDALEFFDDYRCVQAMETLGLTWKFAEGEGQIVERLPSRSELRSRLFTLLREAAMLPKDGAIHREYFLAIKTNDRMCVVFAPYGGDTLDIEFDEPGKAEPDLMGEVRLLRAVIYDAVEKLIPVRRYAWDTENFRSEFSSQLTKTINDLRGAVTRSRVRCGGALDQQLTSGEHDQCQNETAIQSQQT